MSDLPEDLRSAPAPVQEAARYVEKHRGQQTAVSVGSLAIILTSLVSTALMHDVAGFSELASGAPMLLGMVVIAALLLWVGRGPLRHLPARQAIVQRYRTLAELGLTQPADPAEDASAVQRLCQRVAALSADRPEIQEAARAAEARVVALEQERAHLAGMMAEDAALSEQLAGVAERIEVEIARIRAHLAEVYAALIEADAGAAPGGALEDALHRLAADTEVGRAGRRRVAQPVASG